MNGLADKHSSAALILLAGFLVSCGTSPAGNAPGQQSEIPLLSSASAPLDERVDAAIRDASTDESLMGITVHHIEGTVLLTGQVLTEEDKARASNAAAFSGGGDLRRLVNELRVVDEIDVSSAAADGQLAASIERLLGEANQSLAERIEVVVENARVFLLGRVSQAEGGQSAQLVSRLEGVESVRTVFDYTD